MVLIMVTVLYRRTLGPGIQVDVLDPPSLVSDKPPPSWKTLSDSPPTGSGCGGFWGVNIFVTLYLCLCQSRPRRAKAPTSPGCTGVSRTAPGPHNAPGRGFPGRFLQLGSVLSLLLWPNSVLGPNPVICLVVMFLHADKQLHKMKLKLSQL